MRSAKQIGSSVREWHEAQRRERERLQAELRVMQRQWERDEPDWYVWLMKRKAGEHDHGLRRTDGSRAACPVRGCLAVEPLG